MVKRKDNKGRILRDNEYQKSDGRYEYRYPDGKGGLKSVYSWRLVETDKTPAGKKHTAALRELEKTIKRDLEDGIIVQKKVTLNALWDEYIRNKTELKQSTRTNYKYMYDKYVRNVLGNMNVSAIKYSTMKNFFNDLIVEKGFKPASVEVLHTVLHPVFRIAVKDGYIRINPTDDIIAELKRSHDWDKKTRHALTVEQQEAFIDYTANSKKYSHWLPLLTCLLGTGCRIGEMLGLRWCDIDFKEGIISINHSLVYRQQDNGKCEFHITTTKTKNSNRVIPMFKSVQNALLSEKLKQMQNGFCMTEIDGYSGFVWKNKRGTVFNPQSVNKAIDRIVRDYNADEITQAAKERREPLLLPNFSNHVLRHTFCTRLCENETDLKLIQEIMGHADISTTMDVYNESNTTRKKASFERLEGAFKIS